MCLRNALRYAYFNTYLGVFTKDALTCTADVLKLCMYYVLQRSKALDRFMYRLPSALDSTPANEVLVSLLCTYSLLLPTLRTLRDFAHI
jgi:hypothetical protein